MTEKNQKNWTIKALLDWLVPYLTEKGIDAPRLSAELLVAHSLQMDRLQLYLQYDRTVTPETLTKLRELVKRAAAHEPLAYLVGSTEFYSLTIKVTPSVLIPRPETELLVEKAIDHLRAGPGPKKVLDLCTGSGCIAIAIAKNHTAAEVTATDIDQHALDTAAQNIEHHNLSDRVRLLKGNMFEPVGSEKFDLVVSNPPYVSQHEYEKLPANVREYEPAKALLAGPDGMEAYRKIASDIGACLNKDAPLILEIGHKQGPAVSKLLKDTGLFAEVTVSRDLAGRERIVTATGRRDN